MQRFFFLALFLLLSMPLAGLAQQYADAFSYEQGNYLGTTLNYRKAEIYDNASSTPIVVIYLHGGSSKGDDNALQMQEPGIGSIYYYLQAHQIPSIFIVPQCPKESSWGGRMNNVLKALLDDVATPESPRYILGGSMGGTATVGMLSTFPGYFAGGMAVAANPSNSLAANIAQTPFYTVMGTADALMSVSTMEDFVAKVAGEGGRVKMDIEEGWTHETTCKQSYTEGRLSWLFNKGTTSIQSTHAEPASAKVIAIYGMNGQKRSSMETGINLIVKSDGTVEKKMAL